MADSSFRIHVDLADLLPHPVAVNAVTFPSLSEAVQEIAQSTQDVWKGFARGAAMPNGKRLQIRSGEYHRSIQLKVMGDFAAEVYSELPYAQAIEEGTRERDMKENLRSSLRVRLTATGKRYLIIPFRWGHPNNVMGNQMSGPVWGWWEKGDKIASRVTGQGTRLSGTLTMSIKTRQPLMTPSWTYKWGTRLRKADLALLGIGGEMARRQAGMVNFRKPEGKGGGAHSQYITFRIMMEGARGWVRKAQPGMWPARQTAEAHQPLAEKLFAEAVTADVRHILGVADE